MNGTRNDTSHQQESELSKAFKTSAYAIILLTSLIGNTFLILAIKRNINGRMRTVSNLLIASVAVSDLIMTMWSFPERMTRIIANDSWLVPGVMGSILCKMVNFAEKVSITVSVTHLGALSLERFLAVFCPYKTVIKLSYVKYITGGFWAGSILYWSPIFYYGDIVGSKSDLYCAVRSFVPSWRQWYLAFIIILCLVMVIILVLYTAIAVNLCFRKSPSMRLVTQRRKSDHIKKKVVTMVGVIILTFYICFLPYWVGWVWCSYASYMPKQICNQTYKFISILFSYTSCMTNPIVCFTFIGYFRFAFKAILLDPLNVKGNQLRLNLRRKSSLTEIDSVVPLHARKSDRVSVVKDGTQALVEENEDAVREDLDDRFRHQNSTHNGSATIVVIQTTNDSHSHCSESPTRETKNNSEDKNGNGKKLQTEQEKQLKPKDMKSSQNKNSAVYVHTMYGTAL